MGLRLIAAIFLLSVLPGSLIAQTGKDTLVIRGNVVDAVTGQPMDRSDVSIGTVDNFEKALQELLTGRDGSFSFSHLPPGKYWLAATHSGFRKQAYEQHGAFASAIAVRPGLSSDHLIFRLHPDAAITGKITDLENEAVANATVMLFRRDAGSGFLQTYQIAQTMSDDRGYYHFGHLERGRYFVAVSAQPWFSSIAESLRDSSGYGPSAADNADLDKAYAVTYYPGTTGASSASPIVLHESQNYTADMVLVPTPGLRLRVDHGTGSVGISLKQSVFGMLIDVPSTEHELPGDSIESSGIPSGTYILELNSGSPAAPLRGMVIELAADTEINSSDSAAIPAVTGKIEMGEGPGLEGQAFVRLWNLRTEQAFDAAPGPNGEFTFNQALILPGTYSVFLVNGQNLMPGDISATGAKVNGQSIQISGSAPVRITIRVAPQLSVINGVAQHNGMPIPGAMITLVPENAESNLPLFRRDQSDSDGSFTLRDILPGKYKIVGIEKGWDLEWADAAVLKTHLDQAVDVEIRPNMKYQMTVKIK